MSFDERLRAALETRRVGLVIDVGANTGQYARWLRAIGYEGRIVSFEPLAAPYGGLVENARSDPLWEVGPRAAIGEHEGKLQIHVSRNSVSSSALKMLATHLEAAPQSMVVDEETVDVVTLDSAAGGFLRQGDAAFVKIDVQGMEDKVIAGASHVLSATVGIQVELSLTPLYAGQPLLCDIVAILRRAGFELADLHPEFIDPRDGRVLQVDGLFLRAGAP